jgi:regulation of enolase protein 1 (concanavalin A-like superfamily)
MSRHRTRNRSRAALASACAPFDALERRQLMSVTPAILPLGSATALSGTITWPVGIALNVRALDTINTSFQWSTSAGTQFTGTSDPNNTHFAWDFGDTVDGGDTDKLVGFNAAHVYDTPSTDGTPSTYYTLKLTTTDNAGTVATASVLVDVTSAAILATANGGAGVDGIAVPDGMPPSTPDVPGSYSGTRILYVNSSTGNNSYSGTSQTVSGTSGPLLTYGGALAKLQTAPFNDGGAVQIRFERGQTFNVYGTDYSSVYTGVNLKNVLIGAYGSTSTADPKLNLADTGLNAYGMIDLGESSQNVTIQDLEFTSTVSTASVGYSAGVYVRGQNITLRNSTFGNTGHTDGNFNSLVYVQTNVTGQTLDGFLMDNTADNGNWVSDYSVEMFGQFADVAITGNVFTGGSLDNHQPFFRIDPQGPASAGGLDDGRILVSGNTIEPTAYNGAVFTLRDDQLSGDPVVVGYYVYVADNTFNGPVNVGQGTSSPSQTDYAWTVFDGNRVNSTDGTSFTFNQDEYHLTYENNVAEKFAAGTAAAFAENEGLASVTTAPSIYGTTYLSLVNNTVYAASSNSAALSPELTQLAQTYTVTSTGQTLPAVTHVTLVDNLVVNPSAYATTHYGPNLVLYSATQLAADFGNVFVNPTGSTTGSDSRNTGGSPVVNGESNVIVVGGMAESVDTWNAGTTSGRASIGGPYAGYAYDDLSRTVTIDNDSSGTTFTGTYKVTSGNGEVDTTYPGNYYDRNGTLRPTASASTVGAVQTPAAWTDQDIGSPVYPGSATYNASAGTYTLTGGGGDIAGTADAFNFDYQSKSGDGTVTAQVTGQTGTNISGYAKAGVMFRDSTAAGAPMVSIALTPTHGVQFSYRSTSGGSVVVATYYSAATTGIYIRLVRSGSTFTGQYSTDGTTWTTLSSATVTMSTNALAGLTLAAANTYTTNTDTFANVTIS